MEKKVKISQSLMKSLFSYKIGEKCGKQIEAQYIHGVEFGGSDIQELGNYFEYICTGSLARDGHTPEPELTQKGQPTSKYKIMQEQKLNFDNIMEEYGFTKICIDYNFVHDKYSGIADMIAERNGQQVIIDIKTTGLINDKWNDFGWHNDFIAKNENLMIQAKHYKMLAELEWGIKNIPFYFFVFSNTNSIDHKVFQVSCSDESLEQHKRNCEGAELMLDSFIENGFIAIPEYSECIKCPIKDNCNSFTNVTQIIEIEC